MAQGVNLSMGSGRVNLAVVPLDNYDMAIDLEFLDMVEVEL